MLVLQMSFSISVQLTVTQSTHLHKSSATCLTLVWLFSWVNSCVGFKVSWSVELSPADITSIRFLSCSTDERRLSKTLNVAAKMTFVAAAVYFYRCELFYDWQGFPCSGMLLGNGHICMACRCGPEACGVSRLPPLQTWSRIHYRSMFHFLWGKREMVLGGANRFLGNYLEKYLTTAGIGVLRVHLRHLLGQTRGGRVGTDIRVLWRVGATGRAF